MAREFIFPIERSEGGTLQTQIASALRRAVAAGQFAEGDPAPSTRHLSQTLGVSRNTVSIAYQALVDQGVLVARERSGYYFAPPEEPAAPVEKGPQIDWAGRLSGRPSDFEPVHRPEGWRDAPYPFIYGQFDPTLFPIAEWRDATRKAMGRRWLEDWTEDRYVEDDPMLIEEIRKRLLPRRGVTATSDEILITLGAQNALYLAAELAVPHGARAAMEEPGYPDARAILAARTGDLVLQPCDAEGIIVDRRLSGARLIYATPSHQHPTMATMSDARRKALLAFAEDEDALILEDDYEPEAGGRERPHPALRALDRRGRVIYAGSLSKSMMPGLRLGYLVGAPEFIEEARALRRMLFRHPPGVNQRIAALFMSARHHDMLLGRLRRALDARRAATRSAMADHLPDWTVSGDEGGGLWVKGPSDLDSVALAAAAFERGVVIEPGDVFFGGERRARNAFRLGLSVIPEQKAAQGVALLAEVAREL
ncbi:MAG: PLP-dependent aminotransferase family protein [Pseudomonadota bacterium]